MATNAEMAAFLAKEDALTLERAVVILRRRRPSKPGGISLAAFCRVLLAEADAIKHGESRSALRGTSDG